MLICLLISSSAYAQNANISGIVLDSRNTPLENAFVQLNDAKYSAYTDNQGRYIITDVPYGDYTIKITSKEHQEYSKSTKN